MDRKLLDRNAEPVRWEIAHQFALWTTRAATQSQGTMDRFPNKQEDVNAYLDAVEFDILFDKSRGAIDIDEFGEWHDRQVTTLIRCQNNINVGWAAKMIAVYLKTTCYLTGFGRDGLDRVIHPVFDNILMGKMAEYNQMEFRTQKKLIRDTQANPKIFMNLIRASHVHWKKPIPIKDITDEFYWNVLIHNCEIIAKKLECTLFEVEQLWTTEQRDDFTDVKKLDLFKSDVVRVGLREPQARSIPVSSPNNKDNFWDSVYQLRKENKIPRIWKRAHIRPYMERPNGRFAPNSITTIPSNRSMTRDGKKQGDYVKKGQDPKAWRVGPGEFELIDDPES